MLVKTAHNFTAQKYRRLKVKNDSTNKQEFGIGTQVGVKVARLDFFRGIPPKFEP